MKKGFTLVEVLAAVAVIAILAVVVVITINPAELLRQARDANRVSDMATLNKAVALYYQNAMNDPSTMFMGTSSVVYVSLPDPAATSTAGTQCQSLGLPALPAGYTYQCAASSTYMKVNGTGWIPINFASYVTGSVISKLPVDPTNATSSGLYYTYVTDGMSGYNAAAIFESQKVKKQYAANAPLPSYPGVDIVGSDLTINPLFSTNSLVGYWPLNEGSGSVIHDQSGNNTSLPMYNLVNWVQGRTGYVVQMDPSLSTGCVNQNAGIYQSTLPSAIQNLPSGAFTLSWWDNTPSAAVGQTRVHLATTAFVGSCGNCSIWNTRVGTTIADIAGDNNSITYPAIPSAGTWHYHDYVFDYPNLSTSLYVDGVLVRSGTLTSGGNYGTIKWIGIGVYTPSCVDSYPGEMLSEVRLYNRALSPAEIQEMYNAGK